MAYSLQKFTLRKLYGSRCMLCERVLQKKKQSFHHRQPIKNGGKDTIDNGCILCMECQSIIHLFEYQTEAYQKLDNRIVKNMLKYQK